jgi:hypothetical protein
MAINKENLRRRTDTDNVIQAFIKNPPPVTMPQKEQKTLFNMRINERLRDDFKRLCGRYVDEHGNRKDMTTALIEYITKRVEEDRL